MLKHERVASFSSSSVRRLSSRSVLLFCPFAVWISSWQTKVIPEHFTLKSIRTAQVGRWHWASVNTSWLINRVQCIKEAEEKKVCFTGWDGVRKKWAEVLKQRWDPALINTITFTQTHYKVPWFFLFPKQDHKSRQMFYKSSLLTEDMYSKQFL